MSVIALASAKGSPGVTVTALALAAVWPRQVLVAECDPAGGDLAVRWGLPVNPSLLTLAAAARRRLEPDELWRHTQRLPGPDDAAHVRVLLGPVEAEQAAVLGPLWSALGPAFGRLPGVDVLVDVGRVATVAPTMGLLRDADLVLLVARPTPEGIAHARARLLGLQQSGIQVGLLLVGDRPYRPTEVRAALQEGRARPAFLAGLAHDPRAAAMLTGEPGSARRLAGSLLIRSARVLVERLHQQAPAVPTPERPAAAIARRPEPEGVHRRPAPEPGRQPAPVEPDPRHRPEWRGIPIDQDRPLPEQPPRPTRPPAGPVPEQPARRFAPDPEAPAPVQPVQGFPPGEPSPPAQPVRRFGPGEPSPAEPAEPVRRFVAPEAAPAEPAQPVRRFGPGEPSPPEPARRVRRFVVPEAAPAEPVQSPRPDLGEAEPPVPLPRRIARTDQRSPEVTGPSAAPGTPAPAAAPHRFAANEPQPATPQPPADVDPFAGTGPHPPLTPPQAPPPANGAAPGSEDGPPRRLLDRFVASGEGVLPPRLLERLARSSEEAIEPGENGEPIARSIGSGEEGAR
jgi:MinD-like ATPase involved in chromosome partitioning or flagellar assembly